MDRALRILKLLSRSGSLGVTEVAREVGIHKSNAHRMLATLVAHGVVEQDPETEKYRLGFGLVGLASAVTAEIDVVRSARGASRRLSERVGETVIVTTLVDAEVAVVYQTSSSSSVLNVDWSGVRMPLHCTPGGKVLLAHLPGDERDRLLSKPLESFTEKTITDSRELAEQLRQVREVGYAYTVEELEPGLNGVAAPVRRSGGRSGNHFGGEVVAAMGVYGPAFRLPADTLEELGEITRTVADEVSGRLGFSG